MINLLIRYAVLIGTILFLVSLPLNTFPIASKLRRMSGALFILALVPYVASDFLRVLKESLPQVRLSLFVDASFLEVVGVLALVVPIAYAILAVRRAFVRESAHAPSDFKRVRSSGKMPVEHDMPSRPRTLFDDDEEEDG